MADPSSIPADNIIATVVAGVGIGAVAIWQYLRQLKTPTTQTGDRIVPGVSIADMTPFRDIAVAEARTADATERIADAAEGVLLILRDQARESEMDDRIQSRIDHLMSQLNKPAPRKRRPTRPKT